MNWMRWGRPKPSVPTSLPVTKVAEQETYTVLCVTDTETYRIETVQEKYLTRYCEHISTYGAMLNQDGKPKIFIPARRIMEMKFEKEE